MKEQVESTRKSQKTVWVAVIFLLVGFFIGVVFTVYRSGTMPEIADAGTANTKSSQMQSIIERLKGAVQQNPGDLDAWIQLGNAYFDSDQYEPSIEAYQKALLIDPNNANVWTDMGIMYRLAKKPQDAVKAFDNAAEADPRHETCRINKGIVLMHDLNDPVGAIQAWETAMEINPLAMFSSGQSLDNALIQLKKQVKP